MAFGPWSRPLGGACFVFVCCIFILRATEPFLLRQWIDAMRDLRSDLLQIEIWEDVQPTSGQWNAVWVNHLTAYPRVAHGLGGRFGPGENTIDSLRKAVASGFKLLEVDLWQQENGEVVCSHEAPPVFEPPTHGCTLQLLLQMARKNGIYLIIDYKQSFDDIVPAVVKEARAQGLESQVIFQVFQPSDLVRLAALTVSQPPFALPIVSSYKSRRSISYLATQTRRIGLAGLVVDIRYSSLAPFSSDGLPVFVHPVRTCQEQRSVAGKFVPFVTLELRCKENSSNDIGTP